MMKTFICTLTVCFAFCCSAPLRGEGPEWKAGAARAVITPATPVRMAGYSARVTPFQGVAQPLHAKVLALEDRRGEQALLVTLDLIGIPRDIAEELRRGLERDHGIPRGRILLSASHTHSGPALRLEPALAPGASAEDMENTARYTRWMIQEVIRAAGEARAKLEPARLAWGSGSANFAMNRREFTPAGVILGVNPKGYVDRSVPVLRVDSLEDQPKAVLFSYACHNTTLTQNNYQVCGDYAGFAQEEVERRQAGVQAMFLSGCGADANPYPRGEMDLARRHGRELGEEVGRVLANPMRPVSGPLNIAVGNARLPLQRHSQTSLERIAAAGPSLHRATARQMLATLERGGALREFYDAPVAVWQFGGDLTWVALPSEVTGEYVPRLERALGPLALWVTAYANDYFGYIPTPRILEEGGYETRGLFSGEGWFAPEVAESLVEACRELARQAGRALE